MNIPRVLIVPLSLLLSTSCTLSQRDFTGFIPMRDAPKPGYTRVSDYFGVEVTGGMFTPRKILFFHTQADGQVTELIGADLFPAHASRQGAYAISEDGKMLVFVHDERLNQDSLKKKTGLYEFTHGTGDRLIDATAHSGIYVNQTLPLNTIVFRKKNCPEEYCFDEPVVVRTTEGKEEALQLSNKPIKPTP